MKLLSGIKLKPLSCSQKKDLTKFKKSMEANVEKFKDLDRRRREAAVKARQIVLD
jgi:hypothetical protein